MLIWLFIEGVGVGTKICQLALCTTNLSIYATTSLSNKIHSPTSISVTYSLHTFSHQQCHHTFVAHSSILLQPLSSPYNSAHLIHQYPPIPPNYPHVNSKCSTSYPASLSHITHLSSIIILHLFFYSNKPAKPVLSLNCCLTTS